MKKKKNLILKKVFQNKVTYFLLNKVFIKQKAIQKN